MVEKSIPRAPELMNHSDFKDLLDLNLECPWIRSESDGLIELWNLCSKAEQRKLVGSLIRQFELVDSSKLKNYGEQIASMILNDWGAKHNKTRVVAVSDKSEADGSQAVLQSLKNKFASFDGWSEKCFINDLREAVNVAQDSWNIILIDDFIGTGKTIRRKVEWYLEELIKAKKTTLL
jgi:hypothetical protein